MVKKNVNIDHSLGDICEQQPVPAFVFSELHPVVRNFNF